MLNDNLTLQTKKLAKERGADLVGIASVERFSNAPLMLSPNGLLPTAKSVVVVATYFLDASMELMEKEYRLHEYDLYGINQSGTGMNHRMEHIAFYVARFLEKQGHKSLPIASSNIWRFRPYKDIDHPFAPDLVHRYAGVAAGLGELGWHGVFMTPEFGPRVRLTSIVTEAPLEPTPMYEGPALCDRCMECAKRCPTQALTKEIRKINELDIGGKICKFPDINKWRCILDSFNMLIDIPEKNSAESFCQKLRMEGNRGGDQGVCTYVCLPPHLRVRDEAYTRTWRRKRETIPILPDTATQEIIKIVSKSNMEYLSVCSVDDFASQGIDIRNILPDAESVVVIGKHYSDEITQLAVLNRLTHAAFDLTHYLQNLGYSSLTRTLLPDNLMAAGAGLGTFDEKGRIVTDRHGSAVQFRYVLTAAKLTPISKIPVIKDKTIERNKEGEDLTEALRNLVLEKQGDLFGVSSVSRIENILPTLKEAYANEKIIDVVDAEDGLKRRGYGETIPFPVKYKRTIKGPTDYVAGAKSIIVIGLHYPDACIERALEPPAETPGPYAAYAQYRILEELASIGLDVINHLEQAGYKAQPTWDLIGLASTVHHPWGVESGGQSGLDFGGGSVPDALANRFAAVCAGLGEPGKSGVVLTPQFGIRQRFLAIVTDAPLAQSPLYNGPKLCTDCGQCIGACPTQAIQGDAVSVCIDGKEVTFARPDRLRCDWSKRYALVGKTGPQQMSSITNIMPPDNITPEALCDALRQMDPVQKRLVCVVESCLKACPVRGGSHV